MCQERTVIGSARSRAKVVSVRDVPPARARVEFKRQVRASDLNTERALKRMRHDAPAPRW
jgi:hypothetical protein